MQKLKLFVTNKETTKTHNMLVDAMCGMLNNNRIAAESAINLFDKYIDSELMNIEFDDNSDSRKEAFNNILEHITEIPGFTNDDYDNYQLVFDILAESHSERPIDSFVNLAELYYITK